MQYSLDKYQKIKANKIGWKYRIYLQTEYQKPQAVRISKWS